MSTLNEVLALPERFSSRGMSGALSSTEQKSHAAQSLMSPEQSCTPAERSFHGPVGPRFSPRMDRSARCGG